MRAVVWKKAFEVVVQDVPKPEILHPDDIIVKGSYTFFRRFYLLVLMYCPVPSDNCWYMRKVSSKAKDGSGWLSRLRGVRE